MVMTEENCAELITLLSPIARKAREAKSKCESWHGINCELDTNLTGSQITEMIALITTEMNGLIAAYTAAKSAWDGY